MLQIAARDGKVVPETPARIVVEVGGKFRAVETKDLGKLEAILWERCKKVPFDLGVT